MQIAGRARRWRQALAGGAALALAVTLTAAPGPAQAVTAMSGFVGASSGYEVSGATCNGSGGTESSTTFTSNGAKKSRTASDDGSTSNTGDATDNSVWSATATAAVTASQTSTTATISASATLQAALDADLDAASACAPAAVAGASVLTTLAVAQSGWLSVEASLPRSSRFGYSVVPLSSGVGLPVGAEGVDQLRYSGDVWVDPGQYVVTFQVEGVADEDPASPYRPTMSGKATMTATLKPGGSATAPASGPAKSYVAFPTVVNCGDGTVAVPFTSKANKAASATFFVNGKKKAKVSGPQGGTAVVLKGVGGSSDATVKVVVDPGKGKSMSATRSYLACS